MNKNLINGMILSLGSLNLAYDLWVSQDGLPAGMVILAAVTQITMLVILGMIVRAMP